MRVIDLDNIKIPSINNKYGVNPRTGKMYLSKEYREFKDTIHLCCIAVHIDAPYYVYIEVHTASDIDNIIKATLDGIQGKAIKDDSEVLRLVVEKVPVKRGKPGKIIVEVSSRE